MGFSLDHVVLWVEDPLRSLAFFEEVVGLPGVRVAEFRAGAVPFPSVRVSEGALLDLMARGNAAGADRLADAPGSAGHPVNHVCLAMDAAGFDGLRKRLADHGTPASAVSEGSFGARGAAVRSCYFRDPDGNVVEARHYPERG
ncbi:VOC family protein [Peterkaempfera bronchialis]|uniref:VOC family protein n=1 Tax=Peterkaempfera bronchialis TaxID=2126346 RepID=A0A345T1T7_9ACTN|nr:VOC family protein [Peterkaempfera bronchialis]AXI79942.1 VOC family protein [Peterkaempfera bronchialis]